MEKYFSKNIIEIIKKKISLDFIKYKCWCNTEGKWVYFWTEYGICDINIKCPNSVYHTIYLKSIIIMNIIKSNKRILKYNNIKEISDNISNTEFEIINI